MNANDYIQSLRVNNLRLFKAEKITITPESFETWLRNAFNAGQKSGYDEGQNEKSLFQQIFG